MWPWDHLAIGYVVVSLWRRHRSGRPPRGAEAIAVVVGTQFPDLVDKPLGWGTSLLPSGHSLAHSLLVAVPLSLAVYLLGRRFDRGDVGVAFGLAYLSHLPADALYPVVLGRSPTVSFLLWPLTDLQSTPPDALAGRVLELVVQFVAFLRTPRGLAFLAAESSLLGLALLLWWRDGWPGLGPFRRFVGTWTG